MGTEAAAEKARLEQQLDMGLHEVKLDAAEKEKKDRKEGGEESPERVLIGGGRPATVYREYTPTKQVGRWIDT